MPFMRFPARPLPLVDFAQSRGRSVGVRVATAGPGRACDGPRLLTLPEVVGMSCGRSLRGARGLSFLNLPSAVYSRLVPESERVLNLQKLEP